jgi:hypothetical protein
MNWRREDDRLEQILALLVSFAGLADRAAAVPLSLQLHLFVVLTRSEEVARCFLVDLPAGAPAFVAVSQSGDRAERLAEDFRALARILRAVLARTRLRARLSPRRASPYLSECAPARPRGRRVPALPAPDTS